MTAEASQIWSMLEDMSENNPAAYRKFIDKQLKEGKEMNGPPKPHMCVQTCIVSSSINIFTPRLTIRRFELCIIFNLPGVVLQ